MTPSMFNASRLVPTDENGSDRPRSSLAGTQVSTSRTALDHSVAEAVPGGGNLSHPSHIGIIMDGNGRWAKQRHLPRREGHRRGVDALRDCVRNVGERGIKHLTLFAFSSENWKRPAAEVRDLMTLLRFFIDRDLAELKANGVKVRILGDRDTLSPDIRALLERAEDVTASCDRLFLNIAFNYGGRDEIVRAARTLAQAAARGELDPAQINEEVFSDALDTYGHPDPDLIIRTSGELRLSNFLLWQAAYAEFVFTKVFWPDFNEQALDEALQAFSARSRRFGGRKDTLKLAVGS
ncbi:MAG: isoprenyl transferase [Pseudomonadota bacterium]